MGWIVENAAIRAALLDRVRALPSVQLAMPATYTGVTTDRDGATLTLAEGRTLRAGLLVAADGKFSKLRERLGIRASFKDYGQDGIVATLAHSCPHRGLASEHFFPDGPFAVLPMPGDRSSIVWALERALAADVAALPAEAFVAEVADRVGERLGEIELASPVRTFPLVLSTVDRLTANRAALVGDAAHGIHPIAGQGWNLALRDVAALAEITADRAALGLDLGAREALDAYERWRGLDTTVLVAITDGINRLFANDLTPLRLARNLGFAMVDRLPAAKHLFMRHAMGAIGDLPRRMRPRPAA
jgi:2-octaprenyl-6-methoxyphenol hydroxylase